MPDEPTVVKAAPVVAKPIDKPIVQKLLEDVHCGYGYGYF